MEYYRNAIRINPNYVKSHNNLGMALLKQDQDARGVDHFRVSPADRSQIFLRRTTIWAWRSLKHGKLDEAIEHYQKALQLDPDLPEAQLNLGNALMEQGKTEQGIAHIQKAVQLKPDYAEAHNNLGGYLLRAGQNRRSPDAF